MRDIKIKIIDSIMGSGKTQKAISMINERNKDKFIYITPYLDEIKRVKESTAKNNKMYEPLYKGTSKQEDLHKLLREGKSICSTHALFQKSNQITRDALAANNYILILDEVMDVVEQLSDFTNDDLKTLTETDKLAYIEDDYLLWNSDKIDYDGRYNDIKSMALNKNLIFIDGQLLFWNFPVDIFAYFKEVYILTYMFDCQIQRYYYDFHDIEYEKFQVLDTELIPYSKELNLQRISELNKLINVYEGSLNTVGDKDYSLSMSWFKRDDGTLQGILQSNLYNWFNNINRDAKAKYRLWTTFKSYKGKLKGKGYTNRFISLNIRATNEYRKTYVLAYCSNRFVKPNLIKFFSKRGISVNQDEYALSEMLQWIWRSRIREEKEIQLYIPSKRMRTLLLQYLQPKQIKKL